MTLNRPTAGLGLFAMAMLLAIAVPSGVRAADPAPQPGTAATSPAIASTAAPTTRRDQRPAEWAQPIEKPGLPNLHKISEDLYRGAQPDAEGFRRLKAMGIKTVVDLRAGHSDRDEIGDTGLAREHISMNAWHAEDEDVVAFLKIVTDKSRAPIFVHCQYGADRTGVVCAAYRVVVCDWSKDEAIREMTEGGFHFHRIWQNLVSYIRDMNVEKIKREAGLSTSFRKSDGTCETTYSTGASPLWRSKTLRRNGAALRQLAPATVASFRCAPLEGPSRPSKPPATYRISEVHADS